MNDEIENMNRIFLKVCILCRGCVHNMNVCIKTHKYYCKDLNIFSGLYFPDLNPIAITIFLYMAHQLGIILSAIQNRHAARRMCSQEVILWHAFA